MCMHKDSSNSLSKAIVTKRIVIIVPNMVEKLSV